MLHSKSDFDTYFGFFSTIRKILILYEAGVHTKIFVGSDNEKAIAKAALQAIPKAVYITCINHFKKNINHYLMRKEGCYDKERKSINK